MPVKLGRVYPSSLSAGVAASRGFASLSGTGAPSREFPSQREQPARPATSNAMPEALPRAAGAIGAATSGSHVAIPDAQLLRRVMQLSQSASALPTGTRESARGASNGGSRLVGPLPMTRLVLGFNPAPSPHMKKLYSVDERLLAHQAAAALPDPAAQDAATTAQPKSSGKAAGSRDGSFKRPRWANEFSMGIGTY